MPTVSPKFQEVTVRFLRRTSDGKIFGPFVHENGKLKLIDPIPHGEWQFAELSIKVDSAADDPNACNCGAELGTRVPHRAGCPRAADGA